jgi:hypothetical protein
MFVFKYLQMLHTKEIDKKDTKEIDKKELTFHEFQEGCDKNTPGMLLPQATISELVEHYLFQPLKQARNDPSYIQMVSFLSLMFESLNTFAQSLYYTL